MWRGAVLKNRGVTEGLAVVGVENPATHVDVHGPIGVDAHKSLVTAPNAGGQSREAHGAPDVPAKPATEFFHA